MKWLIIIAVIIVVLAVIATMAWLRAARQGPHTVRSQRPHRLDDCLSLTEPADGSAPLAPEAVPPASGTRPGA